MLRIAICDDDKILVTQIEEMLNRYLDKKMIDRYIEIFYDGASLERIYEKLCILKVQEGLLIYIRRRALIGIMGNWMRLNDVWSRTRFLFCVFTSRFM